MGWSRENRPGGKNSHFEGKKGASQEVEKRAKFRAILGGLF